MKVNNSYSSTVTDSLNTYLLLIKEMNGKASLLLVMISW